MSAVSTMDLPPCERYPYQMPDLECPYDDCEWRLLTEHGWLRHLEIIHGEEPADYPEGERA